MYKEIIKQFLPELFESEEMRLYLHDHVELLEKWQIIDMICGAPIPLTRKREMLNTLLQHEDLDRERKEGRRDEEFIKEHSFQIYLLEIDDALRELNLRKGELLILSTQMGSEDAAWETIPFLSYDKVKEHINGKASEFYEKDTWHYLKKRATNDQNELIQTICYFIINGEVTNYYHCNGMEFDYFDVNTDLNLPVPFKCGDIIEADGWPFCGKKRAVIVGIGDNHDCCCIQALHFNDEGKLEMSALKHGILWDDCWPRQSPLYRIKEYSGALTEDEACFGRIQRFIRANSEFWEENGEYLLWPDETPDNITDEYLEGLKQQAE